MIRWKGLRQLEKDDLLKLLGVEERRSGGETLLSGLAWFAAGAAVGAVAALLWAPQSGAQTRRELRRHLPGDGRGEEERNDIFQTPGM